MRDFEDSTLWRISAFEKHRRETGNSGYSRLDGPTVLPTTLTADLNKINLGESDGDTLEVIAACLRHREPALLYLQHQGLVWPVTVFPGTEMLYHCPRDMANEASLPGLGELRLIGLEPPGVRPPGHWMHERVAHVEHYRPLAPLLWALALYGPRKAVLSEIGGVAAYRAMNNPEESGLTAPGALGSAAQRLRRESVSLREISQWPGLTLERASRLLNALYLASGLLITRSNAAARNEPGLLRNLFGRGKKR